MYAFQFGDMLDCEWLLSVNKGIISQMLKIVREKKNVKKKSKNKEKQGMVLFTNFA